MNDITKEEYERDVFNTHREIEAYDLLSNGYLSYLICQKTKVSNHGTGYHEVLTAKNRLYSLYRRINFPMEDQR